MNVTVLGSFTCVIAGRDCVPSAPKLRQLLAVLLLNSNRMVPYRTLHRELWGDSPPASANSILHTYILNLRRASIIPCDSMQLVTQPAGYSLQSEGLVCDFELFESAVHSARSIASLSDRDPVEILRSALDLWNGDIFSDLQVGPVMTGYAIRFNELKLLAIETLVECEIRNGRSSQIIADLASFTNEYPLHEGLHRSLITALYLRGRRAEALNAYGRLRANLIRELALEPANETQRLHMHIIKGADLPDLSRAC